MKITNEKIISLLLAGTLSTGMMPTMINSVNAIDNVTTGITDTLNQSKTYNMNGIYMTIVNNTPVYVYLGNEVENKYLLKEEALFKGEMNYEKVYAYKKTIKNPNYVNNGMSPKNITIYALSGKSNVSGWTKINKSDISSYEKVATSIELGEFLLSNVNLYSYTYNMLGYAYVDINKDGKSEEIIYIGNNKINRLMTKEEAIRYASTNFENYYIQSKTIDNPNYQYGVNSKTIKVYAISEKSYVNGWTRVNKTKVPNDAKIASSIELMNVINHINSNKVYEENTYIPDTPSKPTIPSDPEVITYMKKDEAIDYAYIHFPMSYILSKTIVNPNNSNEVYIIYAFSETINVEGWELAYNDTISPNSCIFLTMEYAKAFEKQLNGDFTKKLK